ncbi:MAG: GNAT family N-acetyltransferase [Angelakisella sp.]
MVKLTDGDLARIKPFFGHTKDTMILSCIEGCMGEAWADNRENPTAVQIIVADFSFFGGDSKSNQASELIHNTGECQHDYLILVPPDEKWATLIEKQYGEHQERCSRYFIKKEGDVFDRQKLEGFVNSLSPEYTIKKIDRELYTRCAQSKWSSDFGRWYKDYEDYEKHGVGFVILHGDLPVAGASSYTWYNGGIEIEIDTKKDYQRHGLATVCASAIILECLKNGIYPSWDADNMKSVELSEKLGYHMEKEYISYFVNCSAHLKKMEDLALQSCDHKCKKGVQNLL